MTALHHEPSIETAGDAGPPDHASGALRRSGGVFGIAFVVTVIAVFVARHEAPLWNDSVDVIRAYWADDGERYLVGQYLASLAGVILFLGFLAALSAALDRSGRESRALSRLVLVTGGMYVTFLLAADAAWATIASSVSSLSDDSLVLLTALDRGAYHTVGLAAGAFVLATSVAIMRTDVFPRWLGIAALVSAAGLLVSPLSIIDDEPEGTFASIGFVSLLLMMLLIVVLSVMMLRFDRTRPTVDS